MSEEKPRGELTPRLPEEEPGSGSALTRLPEGENRAVERFSAGPKAHMVGLTEERGAQIVRQSGNSRNVVFLAVLLIALFIPVYWFYESGVPALGVEGRLEAETEVQYVRDVARGYDLYLANCARCHGEEGQGGIGPPLNDQAKLYNALTPDLQPGSGHLNPEYLHNVLDVGGRYVCGDPNSLMAPWLQPDGPLNYRQVEELIAFLTASSDITFTYEPETHGAEGEVAEEAHDPVVVSGWRDLSYEPPPDATPVPACWRNPSGVIGGAAPPPADTPAPDGEPAATPAPVDGGTADSPRVIPIEATASIQFLDANGDPLTRLELVEGETVQFEVNNTAGFDHNFWIGPEAEVSQPSAETDVGIPTWQSGVQTLTWTVPAAGEAPDNLQFACTVPGHYNTMHGDIVIVG